jgi:endonuclease YncB( thermonuclease family)
MFKSGEVAMPRVHSVRRLRPAAGRRGALVRTAAPVAAFLLIGLAAAWVGRPAAETAPAPAAPAASPAPAASAAPAAAPAPPAPPAFYTKSVSRIRDIEGDSFRFERDDHKVVRVRLAYADCQAAGKTAADQAKAVATGLLQDKPVWVFPRAQAPGSDELWACVWTSKGWLSEVLVRAGYAQRGAPPEMAPGPPAEPFAAAVADCPLPGPPAFFLASYTLNEGDSFDAVHGGRKLKVQLADVTCQGLETAPKEAAKAEAARILSTGPAWVLPCVVHRGTAADEVLAYVWTPRGWLSDALLKAGAAKREVDSAAPATPAPGPAVATTPPATTPAAPATPGPAAPATPGPAAPAHSTPSPAAKTSPGQVTWREIPLTPTNVQTMSCASARFKIEVPEWRVSWHLKPWRTNMPVSLSICRVNENVATGGVSTHVASFAGVTGGSMIRARPGTFWIQVTGSGELGVKVEVPE